MKENDFNLTKVGEFFNVTSNAVKKWCKSYNIESTNYKNFIHVKQVGKYDLDMNLIEVYNSVADAIKNNTSTIRKCLYGKVPSYNGFIWKYIDNNNS